MKKISKVLLTLMIIVSALFMTSGTTNIYAASELFIGNVNSTFVGDSGTSIQINFKTATLNRKDVQPLVEVYYYPSDNPLQQSKSSVSTVMDGYTGYHVATISNLTSATKYEYYVKNINDNSTSKVYSFQTTGTSTNFVVLSNANYRSTSSYTNNYLNTYNAAIEKTGADFIVHTGSLASGTSESYLNGYYKTFNSNIPIIHNTNTSGSSNKYFSLNHSQTKSVAASSDSYVVSGNTLLLNINTSLTSSTDIKNHIAWLRETINNHPNSKWKVVTMSDSFYGDSISTSTMKNQLTPVFDELGIHAVVQGKEAYYSRSYLVKNNVVLDDYPSKTSFAKSDGMLFINPGVAGIAQTNPRSSRTWLAKTTSFQSEAQVAAAKTYTNIKATDSELMFTTYRVDGTIVDEYRIFDGPTLEREIEVLNPIGLNNAFVTQATDNRTFTWQSELPYTEAYILLAPQGQDILTQGKKVVGKSTKSSIYLTSYNANKVTLDNLTPNTTYQYKVGNVVTNQKTGSKTTFESATYTFTTDDTNQKDFSFVHFSDSQSDTNQYNAYWGNTAAKANAFVPEAAFSIHTGDMVEAMNTSNWSGFMNSFGTSFTSGGFFPVLGNHEAKTGESFYSQAFSTTSENGYALNYSFTYGNALFFNLNSNYDSTSELQKQATWIRETIKEKGKDKFIIVSFHKSPYGGRWSMGQGNTGLGSGNIKNILVPVFEEYGVNLVLQGHDHNYLRSYPIKNSVPNTAVDNSDMISTSADGTIYMVSKNSGQKNYDLYTRPWTDVTWNPGLEKNSPNATVFSKIEVKDDCIVVNVYTSAYQLIDSYTIVK